MATEFFELVASCSRTDWTSHGATALLARAAASYSEDSSKINSGWISKPLGSHGWKPSSAYQYPTSSERKNQATLHQLSITHVPTAWRGFCAILSCDGMSMRYITAALETPRSGRARARGRCWLSARTQWQPSAAGHRASGSGPGIGPPRLPPRQAAPRLRA